jgi:hypothetical protein
MWSFALGPKYGPRWSFLKQLLASEQHAIEEIAK